MFGLLFTSFASVERARADVVTLPAIAATADGPNSSAPENGFLGTGAYTNQLFYSADMLSDVPVGSLITGLRVRVNTGTATGQYPTTDLTWNNYDVVLAQAATSFSGMTSDVAGNMLNPQVMHTGAFTVPAGLFTDDGSTPNPFNTYMTFATPYAYQGGDLILLTSHDEAVGAGFRLDAASGSLFGYGVTWKQRISESYDPTSVSNTTIAPILQLEFTPTAIPEPSAFALTAIAGITLWRKRKKFLAEVAL